MSPPSPRPACHLLISDVDDTVKITHVTSKVRAAGRGLLRNAVYAGMAALYRELAVEIVFVSGSPQSLESKLRRSLIERGGFPEARFVLRNWLRERDLTAFKRMRLQELANNSRQSLILVGDDSEKDPEIFLELASKLPLGRVLAIYIRQNLYRPLPQGVVPFATAFELAVAELRAGRLSVEAALRVGEATLKGAGDGGRRLFPPFFVCPPGFGAPLYRAKLEPQLHAVADRLHKLTASIFRERKDEDQ